MNDWCIILQSAHSSANKGVPMPMNFVKPSSQIPWWVLIISLGRDGLPKYTKAMDVGVESIFFYPRPKAVIIEEG